MAPKKKEITFKTSVIEQDICPLVIPMLLNLPSGEISLARFESKLRRLICNVLFADLHKYIPDSFDEDEEKLPSKVVLDILKVCKSMGRENYNLKIDFEGTEPVFEWDYPEDQSKLFEETVEPAYKGFITVKIIDADNTYNKTQLIKSTNSHRNLLYPPLKAQTVDCKYFKACCFALLNSDNGQLKDSELLGANKDFDMMKILKDVSGVKTMPKNAETLLHDFVKLDLLRRVRDSDFYEVSRRFRKENPLFVKALVNDEDFQGETLNRRKNQVAFVN